MTLLKDVKRKTRGRPSVLTDELKFWVAMARNHGLGYQAIATAIGVSSTTIWKFATRGELAKDKKCQALARLVFEEQQRSKELNTNNSWHKGEAS